MLLLTCRIYLNHDSDCDRFSCQFLVQSFFEGVEGGCRFNLLYNIGGKEMLCSVTQGG